MEKIKQIINDFESVAKLAGVEVPIGSIIPEILGAPHTPPKSLPSNKMAVYVFIWGQCHKVNDKVLDSYDTRAC